MPERHSNKEELTRNRSSHHWVSFKTIGVKNKHNGIYTRFTLKAGGMRQTATVRGGLSNLLSSDRRVYFGLGSASKIECVEIF
ncbi:MAG TPA: ASPIC/UnbV domain-containing protein [Chthonomonadales bacterium]|nr:ASPIC/UnbV domain-containing protein [Chthonomonadales bacterium]